MTGRAGRALEGGREDLEDLLRDSAGYVHALIRARLGDTHAAEEAAVETLARIARGLPSLRDAKAYPAWVARIATRCATDAARNGARETSPMVQDPVDPSEGPAAVAIATERAQALRLALDALPGRLRAPILLHHVEGLSCREIAVALGVGLGTVSRRMERARASLRQALGGDR